MARRAGFIAVGPQAHPTLIIYNFIKIINTNFVTVDARTDALRGLWGSIKAYHDPLHPIVDFKDPDHPEKNRSGDPRKKTVDEKFVAFRKRYSIEVEFNANYADVRSVLKTIQDDIIDLLWEICIDHQIMSKARIYEPPEMTLGEDEAET